jgi:hypothetical protein
MSQKAFLFVFVEPRALQPSSSSPPGLKLSTMLVILGLLNNSQPNDTSNINRLMRDALVELLATALFVFAGM